MPTPLTRDEVVDSSRHLSGFPGVVTEILATLDDPDSNLRAVAAHIQFDPVISARVLSAANASAKMARSRSEIGDIYSAVAMIGTSQVREIVLINSLSAFLEKSFAGKAPQILRAHSAAVGMACVEVVRHSAAAVSADAALVAGLLHDIGQLWLCSFRPEVYRQCWDRVQRGGTSIEVVELDVFGADHTMIGDLLGEHWGLPHGIRAAIRAHHVPQRALHLPLVPVLHVADVLCTALDIMDGQGEGRVGRVCGIAFERLGIPIDETIHPLFGRIEARSRSVQLHYAEA